MVAACLCDTPTKRTLTLRGSKQGRLRSSEKPLRKITDLQAFHDLVEHQSAFTILLILVEKTITMEIQLWLEILKLVTKQP